MAASSQVSMPPMPDTGSPMPLFRQSSVTNRRAIGLTMGPEWPLMEPLPWIDGFGENVYRSTSEIPRTVLMVETASAPPSRQAKAAGCMSVALGVSFTITGMETCSFTSRV